MDGDAVEAWERLPAWRALRVWCLSFSLWLAAVPGEPSACAAQEPWDSIAWSTSTTAWASHPWVLAALVDAARGLARDTVDKALLLRLVWLRELLLAWLRPAKTRGRVRQSTPFWFLFYISGWCLALLLTWRQLRASCDRRGSARRRLVARGHAW